MTNADIPRADGPLINSKCTESYNSKHFYLLTNVDIPKADWHSPQIELKCTEPYYNKTVWHCRMQMYPVPMYPLIEPTCTEPYYIRTVWPMTECSGTLCQLTPTHPHLILRPTAPEQYYLLKNAEEPSANWHTLIDPKCT